MRLLTYNIHKGIGGRDRRYDLDRIVRVIEDENPDLICLQEVTYHARRCHYDDQPRLLAHHFCAAASLFQMNVRYRVGGYGNLILSRWPVTSKHQISLRHGRRKVRGAQLVVVETPEGPFRLTNFHLGLAEIERLWQVSHLLRHHLFRETGDLPSLIVGDFNDWRDTLADGPFVEHGYVPVTVPPSRFRSFPAFLPVLALDKAFHKGVIVRHAKVVRTPLAKRASDHLPLVVDFHLIDDGLGR